MTTFRSLYTVHTGLDAARRAMDAVGRNVANANTVGYSRQEVSFVAAEPSTVILSAGRGIREVNLVRYRDEFLDKQYRTRAGSQGYYDTRSQQLSQAEQIVGDLAEGGLRTALDRFFNSWQDLAVHPSEAWSRTQVVAAAGELLDQARLAFDGLAQLRTDLDEAVKQKVEEINLAAKQIAELNQAIAIGHATRQETHELQDRRDMLIDSLAKLAGVTTVQQGDGTVAVYVGAQPLVDRGNAHPIALGQGADQALVGNPQSFATLTLQGIDIAGSLPVGELKGLLELRDQVIPGYMKSLDSLLRDVATQVNNIHTADSDLDGLPDAVPFFTIGANWMAISVNPVIQADPSQILAAGTLVVDPVTGVVTIPPGDGERARAIANLRNVPVEALRALSLQVGLDVSEANRRSEGAALQAHQADQYRQSVFGVSLDDEMTKMIQFQQAYNAAARMMTTIDEMLDLIINRVGLVGR